jgi:hypothetical protein
MDRAVAFGFLHPANRGLLQLGRLHTWPAPGTGPATQVFLRDSV